MCFSPEASFTASGLLAIIGYATLKNISSKKEILLASIPILFSLQQLLEGFLWIYLRETNSWAILGYAKYLYIFFALIFWPIWLPFSLYILEEVPWRKNIIGMLSIGGVIVASYFIIIFYNTSLTIKINNHSIQYYDSLDTTYLYFYNIVVILPMFISNYKNVWMFGALLLIGYYAAEYFYSYTFVSVWCFISAIASILLYKLIKQHTEAKKIDIVK